MFFFLTTRPQEELNKLEEKRRFLEESKTLSWQQAEPVRLAHEQQAQQAQHYQQQQQQQQAQQAHVRPASPAHNMTAQVNNQRRDMSKDKKRFLSSTFVYDNLDCFFTRLNYCKRRGGGGGRSILTFFVPFFPLGKKLLFDAYKVTG